MSGPRILLFGSTGAGKSSLLGALAQAASASPALLKGTLVEEKGGLIGLVNGTYQEKLNPTEKLVQYDVHVKPEQGSAPVAEATLVDTSGESAREMLLSKHPFLDAHPMKKPILDADTVVLIVDAAMPGKQLAEEFQQFARWLMQFHETRGKRTEVGELPVFLVLNKCDLLAKPSDTFALWMQRIEEGKRKIDLKFREFLKKQGTGFGSLQLRLWATAIKRPALSDRPAKAQEPYGVAELFRQCLQSATDYQQRRQTSQYRLHKTFLSMTGLVALLILSLAYLYGYQPEDKHSLVDDKIQTVMPKKGSDPLAGSVKNLEKKLAVLNEIENDPDFRQRPEDSRDAIKKYRDDLADYLKLYDESQTTLKPPQLAKNEEEYKKLKKALDDFKFPPAHAEEWEKTKLGSRVQLLRKEYAQVDKAQKEEDGWFREQIKSNDLLYKQGLQLSLKLLDMQKISQQEAGLWDLACREQLNPKSRKPREQYVDGTRMTYEELDKFEPVRKIERKWVESKTKLKQISDNLQEQLRAGG